jgi:plastocyanin
MRALLFATLGLVAASSLAAQTRHLVRVQGDAAKDEYSFSPATVTAKPGDVIVFRVEGDGRHSVSFERTIAPAAREALNAGMPGRVADLSGPLLSKGQEYVVTLSKGLPAGRYRFFCLPHRAYDEVGWLEVK